MNTHKRFSTPLKKRGGIQSKSIHPSISARIFTRALTIGRHHRASRSEKVMGLGQLIARCLAQSVRAVIVPGAHGVGDVEPVAQAEPAGHAVQLSACERPG